MVGGVTSKLTPALRGQAVSYRVQSLKYFGPKFRTTNLTLNKTSNLNYSQKQTRNQYS